MVLDLPNLLVLHEYLPTYVQIGAGYNCLFFSFLILDQQWINYLCCFVLFTERFQ